jgi:hypothetical protein
MSSPRSETEKPHDVLAAEAFAVPAPDPDLHQEPVVPPEDPLGVEEPHDVLAAEEFPMPAAGPRRRDALVRTAQNSWPLGAAALLGALGVLLLAGLIRRR